MTRSVLVVAAVVAFIPSAGAAQLPGGPITPSGSVIQAQADDDPRVADATLALDALASGLSLTLSAGGALPVSPSTAGMRIGGSRRIVVDGGLLLGSFRSPDLRAPPGSGGAPEQRHFMTGVRGAIVVGVFEGFSPAATVGGVLSFDLVATARYLRTGDGYDDNLFAWGGGARVGILRESFTLPGVTLQFTHLRAGEVTYGTRVPGGAAVRLKPNVTSVRGGVGKDLLAFGVTAGFGVDWIGGTGRIAVADDEGQEPPPFVAPAGMSGLDVERRYLFGGVNFTWVVMQAAGEISWVRGQDPKLAIQGTGPYTGGEGSLHGTLTVRITY